MFDSAISLETLSTENHSKFNDVFEGFFNHIHYISLDHNSKRASLSLWILKGDFFLPLHLVSRLKRSSLHAVLCRTWGLSLAHPFPHIVAWCIPTSAEGILTQTSLWACPSFIPHLLSPLQLSKKRFRIFTLRQKPFFVMKSIYKIPASLFCFAVVVVVLTSKDLF